MNGKISVIMPAYNSAMRIEHTIRKIEEQTYKNFELIIVNDGSNDTTEAICKSLSDEFKNIIIISQPNAGPSKARENGVKRASGEYIAFIDSDDYYENNAFEHIINVFCKFKPDIVQFGFYQVNDEKRILGTYRAKSLSISKPMEIYKYFMSQRECTNYLWDKIYRADLFRGLEWPPLFYSEDYAVLAQLFSKSCKLVSIEVPLYYYVQHSGSIIKQPFSTRKLDQIRAGDYVVAYTKKSFPEFVPEALYYIVTRSSRLALEVARSNNPTKQKIYKDLLTRFRAAYQKMNMQLKKQHRTIKLDKTTRCFLISPLVARLLYDLRKLR